MKFMNSKYLKKLVAFSLIVGTFPVLILGSFSYYKSSSIIQKKVNEANLQVLLQTQMRVEEVLKSIHSYYIVMANSPAINDYLRRNLTYKDFDSIKQIQNRLAGMQGAQISVASAYYINIDNDWVVGTDGISTVDEKINKIQFLKSINDFRSSFWMYNFPEYGIFKDMSPKFPSDNLSLIIKLPLNSNKPSGAIVVNILGYEFNDLLHQESGADEMLILSDNYQLLLRNGKGIFSEKIPLESIVSILKNNEGYYGFFNAKINNKSVAISFRRSEYNNWTYVSIYSIKNITSESRGIGWVTLIICFFIFAFTFIVSIFGSKIIYNPIRNIYETVMKGLNLVNNDEADDEFKYIGEGIDSLVKTKSQMEEQIKNQLTQLEELFLVRLINGELYGPKIDERLKVLGYNKEWELLCVMSLQIDSFKDTEYSETDKDIIMLLISDIIKKDIDEGRMFNPIIVNKMHVVLLKTNEDKYEEFKNYIYDCALKIQEKVKNKFGLNISMGISRLFSDLDETQIAYKESVEALMCRIRFGEQSVLYFEDIQPDNYIRQSYPIKIENDLIEAINTGNKEKANSLLSSIIDEILKEKLSFNEYQIFFMRLLINIVGILQDSGESVSVLFQDKKWSYNELYILKNSYEIKKWFESNIINPVIDFLEERRGTQYKNILDEVINMIHNEYDTDLSLESCAERLHYHPSYIWRVLKKELDTNFSDYLAKYKLNIAKKWLGETDMPVSEIAEKLKYNNSQNFIRFFKKMEGITPGQYRNKVRMGAKSTSENLTV